VAVVSSSREPASTRWVRRHSGRGHRGKELPAIIELLGQLRAEMGLSLLFITHDLALIRTIADQIAVVTGGHVVEYGPCAQIFTSPSADYTRKLLANTPSMEVALGQATAPAS
jgi:ABC-type dipeptide/oligopeptide/nickel transport system ATPase component